MFKRLYRRLFKKAQPVLYKIGNMKRQNARIDALTPMFVEIGDGFVSAPGSIILSHDASPFVHTNKYRVEKTTIGDNVFLGANAVIMPGITVGDGAIIGAGSVVTKDVDANCVVAGNPARALCTTQEYIERCEKRGVLYDAPEEFALIYEDKRPNQDTYIKFQQDILKKQDKNEKNSR